MNVLAITNLYPRPDQPTRGLFNAQLFAAMSADVTCLVPEWRLWRWGGIRRWRGTQVSGLRSQVSVAYLPVWYLPLIGRSLSWKTYAKGIRSIEDKIRQCDAVLSSWLYPDAVAAVEIARQHNKPVWIRMHGSDTFHLKHSVRRKKILEACKYASGVLPNCEVLANRLVEAGVDAGKVHVVENGVDGEVFGYRERGAALTQSPVASRPWPVVGEQEPEARSQKPADGRMVLYVGNLVRVKGPDILLAAWRLYITQQPNNPRTQQLAIIGSGPMRRQLDRQARSLGIADSVTFLGNRPHEEVAQWMNAADCLCLTSRSEGMPNVVIEALASGLPVVATAVGAVEDMLLNEPCSRVVSAPEQPNNPTTQQLSTAIAELLEADVDRKAMAERNKDRFSWEKAAGRIVELMSS